METNNKDCIDRITQIYVGKNILVTGGSGFIGKVFIEKLLRECSDINCIYLLLRSKKGKDPQTRLEDIFASPLFDKLKSMKKENFLQEKCKVIAGDISEMDLGISKEDRKLLVANVNYIYHSAATVRFDEPLKSAILLNTRGTECMLELAKQCKQLQLFCHISTAYVNPKETVLKEKTYEPVADPYSVIKIAENLPSSSVDLVQKQLLAGLPNNYTFTKSLSESLIADKMDSLPIILVRPSVVVPIWKEPLPGWTDNINGPVGLLIGAGKGVIRSMYCIDTYYADFIPVDVVANLLAVTSWDYLTHKQRRIYNFTTSDEVRQTWKELIDLGKDIVHYEMPFNNIPWYPDGSVKNSKILHYLAVFFYQLIPSFLLDCLLFCLGYKPFLCRIQKRIINGYEVLEYYATNQWFFVKDNTDAARKLMNDIERKVYVCERNDLNIKQYLTDVIHGARLYILKETDDTLPAARKHLKIMWWAQKIYNFIFWILIIYLIYNLFAKYFI